jgi:hypothetical protein
MICAEINRLYFTDKGNLRAMCISDNKILIFKLYTCEKIDIGTSDISIYKFVSVNTPINDKSINDCTKCFYLFDDTLALFVRFIWQ